MNKDNKNKETHTKPLNKPTLDQVHIALIKESVEKISKTMCSYIRNSSEHMQNMMGDIFILQVCGWLLIIMNVGMIGAYYFNLL